MATRQISEKMSSGELTSIRKGGADETNEVQNKIEIDTSLKASGYPEIDLLNLDVNGNIFYPALADPAYVDMLVAIGANGGLKLTRNVGNPQVWTDTDVTQIPVEVTESAPILILTPDENIYAGEGAYEFHCSVDNGGLVGILLTFIFYVDGVEKDRRTINVPRLADGTPIHFSGLIAGAVTSLVSVVTMTVQADDIGVTIRGDEEPTTMHIARTAGTGIYKYTMNGGITVTAESPTFQEIARVEIAQAPAGIYEYKFSLTTTIADVNDNAHIQFSIDGGNNWDGFIYKAKATPDHIPVVYFFPREITVPTDLSLILQAAKDPAAGAMTISFVDVIIDKK